MRNELVYLFIISLQFLLSDSYIYSQQPIQYHIWVKKTDNTKLSKGYFEDYNNNEIKYLNKEDYRLWLRNPAIKAQSIPVQYIESLQFRKSGKVGKGILFGALIGGAAGGLFGVISNESTASSSGIDVGGGNAFAVGFGMGAILGGTIGGIIGAKKITIPINGEIKNFERQKEDLKKYLIKLE